MNRWIVTLIAAEEEGPHRDDKGQVITHHWLWPEKAELIYGTISSIIIFALLYKLAWPAIRKGLAARTERIRNELDAAAKAKADAEAEAAQIRAAKGDIGAERQRLLGEADAQAEALLTEGRARLDQEIAELQARADADIAAGGARVSDEMRAEIARVASDATDNVLTDGLDAATHQNLIESFIQKVGASR